MPDNIENSKVSVKTLVIVGFFIASGCISGTIAWMTVVHANERVEYINDRLDKITKRNAEAVKEVADRVTVLELPNSDK